MARLKERLISKSLSIGSWIQFGYPQTTEIMAKAGFDFIVIDMEHTSIASHELFQCIQLCSLAGLPVLVRVGANDPLLVKRAMDAGADGIIMPMVETREQAEMARDAVYYPPAGKRGVGLARAQGYGLDFDDYVHRLRDEMIVIVMIEHYKAVAELERILSVDGIDGFFLGPYDMSASLGKPGQFDDPEVSSVLSRVGAIAKNHPKPSGIHVVHPDPALLAKRIDESYKFIAYGTDMVFFSRMIRDSIRAIQPLFKRTEVADS